MCKCQESLLTQSSLFKTVCVPSASPALLCHGPPKPWNSHPQDQSRFLPNFLLEAQLGN